MANGSNNGKKVVLVGHCGPDNYMLRGVVSRILPEASVVMVNSQGELDAHADGDALLLVNRVLDGRFDASDGIDLIHRCDRSAGGPVTMLISNYAEAQERAVQAGAVEGFGKSALGSPDAAARLRGAMARVGQPV